MGHDPLIICDSLSGLDFSDMALAIAKGQRMDCEPRLEG
jgi:hypothetical protein